MKVALLCGGPSLERGISLNSARSALDHLEGDTIEIVPVYFDHMRRPYAISTAQLYSNTPSDFDFKLQKTATPLSRSALIKRLKSADIAFPVMHGPFGEDGGIQQILEKERIPFVGTPSGACKRAFDKFVANEHIRANGFFTLPSAVLKIYKKDHKRIIERFFKEHNVARAVVKPATGGSSIGVFSVQGPGEALEKAELLFSKRMDTRVVVEPFAEGREFTVIILENRFGLPVALLPTEIETDYTEHQIFDYRKKYLPTRQVTYHCPPRFDDETIERIQAQAEQLFAVFGMKDFARFDGWVFSDGNIWFSDLNPISGMEQNSFLFQQSSRIGMSHRDTLRYILRRSCERQGIPFPERKRAERNEKKPVHIIFGGKTSERQVSLMSGTNVWLKLRRSRLYEPKPFLLGPDGDVWEVPYALILNHTVEEIAENCRNAEQNEKRLGRFERRAKVRLGLSDDEARETFFLPERTDIASFMRTAPFVFLALHGGDGENGTFQTMLERYKVPFNGSESGVSRLCMDKFATAEKIRAAGIPGVGTAAQKVMTVKELPLDAGGISELWRTLRSELGARTVIAKPTGDGCSSGIVRLFNEVDLGAYIDLLKKKAAHIPAGTFRNQRTIIEMPLEPMHEVLFEEFIETDAVRVKGNDLKYTFVSGWLEVTVGVLGKKGEMRALEPSITVAEGEVLSVEEKFQGGTGVNITPPPEEIVPRTSREKVKRAIEQVAKAVGIHGYARIDAFIHAKTGEVKIIEVNTLPGLTPSTVLYHQGLAEDRPLGPRDLLERIIRNAGY